MNVRTLIAVVLVVGGFFLLYSLGTALTNVSFFSGGADVSGRIDVERLSARAALIADADSGGILAEKNADTAYPMASVTKLFIAHIAHKPQYIDRPVQIVWQDYVTEGGAGGLWLGEYYTIRKLLFPLLLASSNDASAAIVRTIGRVQVDEELATLYRVVGLASTNIEDAAGLKDTNRASARDLATFVSYLDKEDRYVLDITTLHTHLGTYRGLINNNPARSFDEFAGGKHGYTPRAGRTFAGMFKTDQREYIVVLLGSNDLEADLEFIVPRLP